MKISLASFFFLSSSFFAVSHVSVYTVEKKVEDANKSMFGLALVDKKTPRTLPSARLQTPQQTSRGSARQK
jgi:hypothetical protein